MDDFRREIIFAAKQGIDGFALNVGAWSKEPYYKQLTERLFAAAKESGTNFRLFFSFDGLKIEDSIDALMSFALKDEYLKVGNKLVVSTFGENPEWAATLRAELAKRDTDIFYVPNYYYRQVDLSARLEAGGLEVYSARRAVEEPGGVDGYFLFGAGSRVSVLVDQMARVIELVHSSGKVAMVGISPYYKGLGPRNSRVFESRGFVGMESQWLTAIRENADWVELVTWNDWSEATYLGPLDSQGSESRIDGRWGPLLNHLAFLQASQFYIQWFKSGQKPKLSGNKVFYFYRLHPKESIGITGPQLDPKTYGQPRGWDQLEDSLFVTAFLSEPVALEVSFGDQRVVANLPSGVSDWSTPFYPGKIKLGLRGANGSTTEIAPEFEIGQNGLVGNFNYFGGEVTLP